MTPKLSILICSLPSRLKRHGVIEQLSQQSEGLPVEVLYLGDNKVMTVGEKRNILVAMARGEYVAFVDDDDRVSSDYVSAIFAHCNKVDVVCFQALVSGYDPKPKKCLYSLSHPHGDGGGCYLRKPNHLMAWKRELYLKFKPINNGEDDEWAGRMVATHEDLKETVINRVLYYYDFNTNTTEAQR